MKTTYIHMIIATDAKHYFVKYWALLYGWVLPGTVSPATQPTTWALNSSSGKLRFVLKEASGNVFFLFGCVCSTVVHPGYILWTMAIYGPCMINHWYGPLLIWHFGHHSRSWIQWVSVVRKHFFWISMIPNHSQPRWCFFEASFRVMGFWPSIPHSLQPWGEGSWFQLCSTCPTWQWTP